MGWAKRKGRRKGVKDNDRSSGRIRKRRKKRTKRGKREEDGQTADGTAWQKGDGNSEEEL